MSINGAFFNINGATSNPYAERIKEKSDGDVFITNIFDKNTDITGRPIQGMNFVRTDLTGNIELTKETIPTENGHRTEFRDENGQLIRSINITYHDDPYIVDRKDTDKDGNVYRSLYHDGTNTYYKDANGNIISSEEFNQLQP